MSAIKSKLFYSMLLAGLALPAYWMIQSAQRNRDLQLFFSEDLVWAKVFSDGEFDFCKFAEWPSSHAVHMGYRVLFKSPNHRFALNQEDIGVSDAAKTKIVDLLSNQVVLVFPYASGSAEVKWDLKEKYAIALLGVSKDDFSNAKIYIGNLRTGKSMFLKNAMVSSCDNPPW